MSELTVPNWFSPLGVDVSHLTERRGQPLPPGKERDYISWSQIKMVLRCERQYWHRYKEGIKTPPPAYLIQGSNLHKVQEIHYRSRIAGYSGFVNPNDARAAYEYYLKEACEREEIDWAGSSYERTLDDGTTFSKIYFSQIEPSIRPLEVELPFRVKLGDDFPFLLHGYIDLLDGQNGVIIADTKFMSKKPTDLEIRKDLQSTAYAAAYRIERGKRETMCRLDCVIKTKKPYSLMIPIERTNQEIEFFFQIVEGATRKILRMEKEEDAVPDPTHYRCSEGQCGYWRTCMGSYGF
ncbi:MAG: PD-(D/E)XK nuclease family protein [bacterium]|nr:PD-(D/E)XK nuclease family protein [bacterium]